MDTVFSPQLYKPNFRFKYSQISTALLSTQIAVQANPMRLALLFSCIQNTTIVGPSPDITSQVGIPVSNSNSPVTIDYSTYGALVGEQWYFNQPMITPCYVVEVIWVDQPECE